MTNKELEKLLNLTEALMELHEENPFKSRAYGRAARAIRSSGFDVIGAAERGEPIDVDGVGAGIAAEIVEFVQQGTSSQFEDLMERTPNGLLDVMQIRGLGAKKVRLLWRELGIESLEDLEAKGKGGEIAALKGFGKKTEENILNGIAELKASVGKMRLSTATVLAERLIAALSQVQGVDDVRIVGRLRRGSEIIEVIDLLVQTESEPKVATAIESAQLLSEIETFEGKIQGTVDETYAVRIYFSNRERFPLIYHQLTGASDYRFMISIPLHDRGYELEGVSLTHDGKPVYPKSEEELFDLAGMSFIPPELREGIDEIRLALEGELPELVTQSDFRGVLHVHSTWSDGQNSLDELADHAVALGYRYLLICDHSKAAFYANGLDEQRLEEQGKEIDEINRRFDPEEFRLLKGTECDILTDGSLDLADDALAALDCVIVSVHSNFTLPSEAQTDRVCRALEHPYSSILAHPTGRLILSRKGYPIDLKRVIETAADQKKIIELNANPYRLDLDWRMVRYARRKGVPIAINPDAHSLNDFDYVRYGITMGRKAGLAADDVLNTVGVEEFLRRVRPAHERDLV